MLHWRRPATLSLVAFASGFAMMAFELVAARILAPTIGSSTFIWTNVIGVIMAALALGYYLGGRLADRRYRDLDIAVLCIATATLITLVLLIHPPILDFAHSLFPDARWQGLVAALLLFALPSIIIGMISPYLAKISLKSTSETGATVARLSTANAIGSIAGTFITGFFLFGIIGSRATLVVVIIILVAASWLVSPRRHIPTRLAITVLLLVAAIATASHPSSASAIQIDTAVSSYTISQGMRNQRPVTTLSTGPGGTQSASYNSGPKDLVFWYTQQIADIVATATPTPSRLLVIGGGAYTLPEYLARKYPDATVDVVEIDPKLAAIARQYFRFEQPANLHIYAEDARSYINRLTDTQYDVIILDVFSDTSIPWQFLTQQFGAKAASLTTHAGIIIVNFIAAPTPACQPILSAQLSIYSPHLPHTYTKPQLPGITALSNHEIIFSRTPIPSLTPHTYDTSTLPHPYTDDFAPIEHLWQQCEISIAK